MSTDISTKGLDDFSVKFLGGTDKPSETEYINVKPGQKITDERLQAYYKSKSADFIRRAGSFTEDLIGFLYEQREKRGLSAVEAIFGIALANINLRESYARSPEGEAALTDKERQALYDQFDEICGGAQDYYDANKDD